MEPIRAARSRRKLRRFGLTMAVALGLLAAFLWWRDRSWWPYVAGAGTVFLVAGLLAPGLLRPVERVWMKFAELLGAVMTRVILTLAYVLAVTPVAVVMRLRRKDLLGLRLDAEAETYWEPVEPDGPATRLDKPY